MTLNDHHDYGTIAQNYTLEDVAEENGSFVTSRTT
jgi:hypothetical protein